MPVLGGINGPNLPSLETINNLIRAICNDAFAGVTSTPGEGQVLTDYVQGTTTNNPFVLNLINSAIRELYRKLRIMSSPSTIQDNYILEGLPVVNGPLGPNQTDPTIQNWIDNSGFWDGSQYWGTFILPTDMLNPLRVWERQSGTTDTFIPMRQKTNGLPPRNQLDRFEEWEWRYERINFVGSILSRDIRIRYQAVLPQFFTPSISYATTYVPIIDCEDFVAYKTAEKIALALGNLKFRKFWPPMPLDTCLI